jgi:hypothetical protein
MPDLNYPTVKLCQHGKASCEICEPWIFWRKGALWHRAERAEALLTELIENLERNVVPFLDADPHLQRCAQMHIDTAKGLDVAEEDHE